MTETETMRAAREKHPEFPWLALDDLPGLERFLGERGWLAPDEAIVSCKPAGDGNMNWTVRVQTHRRSFIVKQARPWVEKYSDIPAPWDRSLYEERFYRRASRIEGVRSRMPALLGSDPDARVIVLEDLPDARDLTSLYGGDHLTSAEVDELVHYLVALHGGTAGDTDASGRSDATEATFLNREMRLLNHEHLFRVPLAVDDNGLDLDAYEPGLADAARTIAADSAYRAAVEATGEHYLANAGICLVHGDYFPGSWLRSAVGLRVIDPEFAHRGHPELDLGGAVAHLALARQDGDIAARFVDRYAAASEARPLDRALLARYAAVEVMRRLIGVAQLPLPSAPGTARRDLLRRAHRATLDARWQALFAAAPSAP